MSLYDVFRQAAARVPDRDAVVYRDHATSYRELARRTNGAAEALRGARRVALVCGRSSNAIATFWGAQAVGAEVVDIPLHVGASSVQEMLDECRPDVIVQDDASAERLALSGEVLDVDTVTEPKDDAPSSPRVSGGSVALTIYTSGSTGRPKGVMLTHDNLLSNVTAAAERMPLPEGDRLLVVVPMYFIHGRTQLLAHTRIAGTLCLSRGFQFPRRVLTELERYAVNGMSGVPFHFATLLTKTRLKETSLPSLRYVLVTGGALERSARSQLARALPGVEIHTAYGSTEASPRITYASPADLVKKPQTAGRALPGVIVSILGGDGLPVPRGALGEVACSGPNVMAGYVSRDHVTSGRIDDHGRLRTGDLGRLDGDGDLFLAGRLSDMIKTAGERVFPREIEAVLERHPDVLETAVVGVPDDTLGERIVALVVLVAGATADGTALRAHARAWLPFVRAPREVYVVDRLPKTASDKLRRSAVVEAIVRLRANR